MDVSSIEEALDRLADGLSEAREAAQMLREGDVTAGLGVPADQFHEDGAEDGDLLQRHLLTHDLGEARYFGRDPDTTPAPIQLAMPAPEPSDAFSETVELLILIVPIDSQFAAFSIALASIG